MLKITALGGALFTLSSPAAADATEFAHRWQQCGRLSICEIGDRRRVVFQAPRPLRGNPAWGRRVLAFLRWSRTAGVVSIDLSSHLSDGHAEFWTRDGGKHWWRTDVFNVGLKDSCATRDDYFTCVRRVVFRRVRDSGVQVLLFGVEGQLVRPRPGGPPEIDPLARTYRLEGWVPRGRATCPGRWLGSRGREVCWGPAVNAAMSASER